MNDSAQRIIWFIECLSLSRTNLSFNSINNYYRKKNREIKIESRMFHGPRHNKSYLNRNIPEKLQPVFFLFNTFLENEILNIMILWGLEKSNQLFLKKKWIFWEKTKNSGNKLIQEQ